MNGESTPSIHAGGETPATSDSVCETEKVVPAIKVGALLRQAREEKFVSIDDVSRALKITNRQVEAIEADDWSSLSCTTIIRGFVRNYARLLGKDPEVFMQALGQMQMPLAPELQMKSGPTVKLQPMGRGGRRDLIKVAMGLLFLLLAVVAYFFAPADFLKSPQAFLGTAMQSQTAIEKGEGVENTDGNGDGKSSLVANELPVQVDGTGSGSMLPAAPAPAAAVTTASAVAGQLQFSFSEPAWVEVKDGKGAIIFSQLSVGGSQQNVSGQAPFSLVIGNAGHVTLQYKGLPVDLSKRSKDDVARLTLE